RRQDVGRRVRPDREGAGPRRRRRGAGAARLLHVGCARHEGARGADPAAGLNSTKTNKRLLGETTMTTRRALLQGAGAALAAAAWPHAALAQAWPVRPIKAMIPF